MPTVAEIVSMTQSERLKLLVQLDADAEAISRARGALQALLHEPPPPPALIGVKEAARRLSVSTDYIRDHGQELDIEVPLGDGLCRYDPVKVEAVRKRRRPRSGEQALLIAA